MVSILLGVWNGGGVCCCGPAQCSGVARALLIPLQCWRVLLSCRALFHCRVCGVRVVSVCPCCLCGGVSSSTPPLVVVEGGAVAEGRGVLRVVGGMVSEGRLCCWPPRLVRGVPLVVYSVVLLNGGGGGLCCCPPSSCCPIFPVLFRPSSSHPRFSSVCVVLCLLWVGKCGGVRRGRHDADGVCRPVV